MTTAIIGTGSYLPEQVISNCELAKRLGISEQWITDKTGIKERRIADPGDATSDLATRAAERALEDAGVHPADIDLLVLGTANPDQPLPATACFVQRNLGASRATAFDVSAACTGFIFALAIANDMLLADPDRKTALVIGADIYSRSVDYDDRKTCVLLGDGAGAVVLTKNCPRQGVLASKVASDGGHYDLAYIPAGGTRKPGTPATLAAREHFLKMRGREVRDTVAALVPGLIAGLMARSQMSFSDVDLIVPHQANGVMLSEWAGQMNVASETVYQTIDWSGNTGAASVPIALHDAVKNRLVHDGDRLLLIAFGAGITWGGVVLEWVVPNNDSAMRKV